MVPRPLGVPEGTYQKLTSEGSIVHTPNMNFVRVAGRLVNLRHVVQVQKGDMEHVFTLTPHMGSSFMALGSGNADLEPLSFEVTRKDHPEDFKRVSAWIDSFPTF